MVKIAQCLCPKRHCILALADMEGLLNEEEHLNGLMAIVAMAIARDPEPEHIAMLHRFGVPHMNSWCGLCGALWNTWNYEVALMAEGDPDQALVKLCESESNQRDTAESLKRAGLAYDSRRN